LIDIIWYLPLLHIMQATKKLFPWDLLAAKYPVIFICLIYMPYSFHFFFILFIWNINYVFYYIFIKIFWKYFACLIQNLYEKYTYKTLQKTIKNFISLHNITIKIILLNDIILIVPIDEFCLNLFSWNKTTLRTVCLNDICG